MEGLGGILEHFGNIFCKYRRKRGPLKMQEVGQNTYIIEETWANFSFLIYKKDTNQSCEELTKP